MKEIITNIFSAFAIILIALDTLFILICGALKLYGLIDWSWVWIFAPLIWTGVFFIALLIIVGAISAICGKLI